MHRTFCLAALLGGLAAAPAMAGQALLAFAGDIDLAEVGEAGACGERRRLSPDEWQRVVLRSEAPVWLFANAVFLNGQLRSVCRVARSFTPQAGEAYILQVEHAPRQCRARVLQAVPGADPRPVPSQRVERDAC